MPSTKPYLQTVLVAAIAVAFPYLLTAAAPVVSLSNPNSVVVYSPGDNPPANQTVTVTSSQPVAINSANITYSTSGAYVTPSYVPWLSAFGAFGATSNTPLVVTLAYNPTSLPQGMYFAQVQLNTAVAVDPASVTVINVYLTVISPGQGSESITTSTSSLSFSYAAGGALPAAQQISVTTSDGTAFTVQAQTTDGGTWLSATPASSPSPGIINVSVNPAGLSGTSYTGVLTFVAPSNIVTVNVTFSLTAASLTVSPLSLTFNVAQGSPLSPYQPVQVTAGSPFPFTTFVTDVGNWLQVDTSSGTTPATINVRVNGATLVQGTYTGTVTVQSGSANQFPIAITVNVGPPALFSITPGSLSFNYQVGAASPPSQAIKITPLALGTTQAYTVAAATTTGGNWLTATAATGTVPDTDTVTVNPSGLVPGTYSGIITVTPTNGAGGAQTVSVSLTVTPASAPVIMSVTSAASFASGAVAPGEFVVLFGSGLGPATLISPTPGTFPTILANTTVSFSGIPAPILYASATQTSVQVPYGIPIGQTSLSVQSNGMTSQPANLPSVLAFPGVFTSNAKGTGQAAALNQDLSLNTIVNPAARGTVIVLYGTGEGATNPRSVEGVPTPVVAPFPQPVSSVSLTIGGQPAVILYAGETPGVISGLLQINAVIPTTISAGLSTPVLVSINGLTSQNGATIAIK